VTTRQAAKRLWAWLRPYLWPHFLGALACMSLYSASSGAVPWLVKSLVDDIFARGDQDMLRLLPPAIIAVFAVRGAMNFGQAYLSEWVGQRIVRDLRQALDEHILRLPLGFFDRASSANLVARITSDVALVRQALTEGAAAMIRDLTTVVVLVAICFWMDPWIATIAFVVIPAVVVPLQGLSRRMRRLSVSGLDRLGGLSGLLQETIQGARVVKAFGMEGYEGARFAAENERLLGVYLRAAKIKAFTTPLMEVVSAFGIAGVLWYGGTSVLGGERTVGNFMAILAAIVLLYDPFKKIVRTNNIVQTGLGAAERVFSLLDVPTEHRERPGHLEADGLRQAVRYENVGFAYERTPVLHGVDLEIPAGSVVALVGPSGAGKSTIADLLPRFYEVSSGRITLDGVDIRDIRVDSLRRLVAVVTQQTFLFNDTVLANIAYGHTDVDRARVEEAARAANAHEFIERLDAGYDTVVGEMGVQLSGGQRQRLAIARALLKDAPLLVLDEATSSLDSESEHLVQQAVENLMRSRTTLVIAHRLSTVRRADRIAVVVDGRIEAVGRHQELLETSSVYRRLHEMQFRDEEGNLR
jgi:subfamily B ATP-binding cassette protein MsbA